MSIKCPKCGTNNPDHALWCKNCGADLTKVGPPPTPPSTTTKKKSKGTTTKKKGDTTKKKGRGPLDCAACGRDIYEEDLGPPHEISEGVMVCDECYKDLFPGAEEKGYIGIMPGRMLLTAIISSIIIGVVTLIRPSLGGFLAAVGIIFFLMEHALVTEGLMSYIRASFRTFGFLCLGLGLGGIPLLGLPGVVGNRPVFKLIPLGILAIGLLTYNDTAEIGAGNRYSQAMAFQRMVMGALLAILFLQAFWSGLMGGGGYLGFAMAAGFACLAFGFFVTFPRGLTVQGTLIGDISDDVKEVSSDIEKAVMAAAMGGAGGAAGGAAAAAGGGGGGGAGISIGKVFEIILFFILMGLLFVWANTIFGLFKGLGFSPLAALGAAGGIGLMAIGIFAGSGEKIYFSFLTGLGMIGGSLSLAGVPYAIFMFQVLIFMAYIAGFPVQDARPIIGIPMIFLALMAATTAYPSVMGQAIFGQWWPTVYNKIQGIQRSLSPAMGQLTQAQTTLGKGWTCLASPQQCYQIYKPKTKVAKTYRALTVQRIQPIGIGKIDKPPTQMDTSFRARVDIQNALTTGQMKNPPTIENVRIEARPVYDAAYRRRTLHGPKQKQVGVAGDIMGGNCEDWKPSCEARPYYPGMKGSYTLKYTKHHFHRSVEPGNYLKYGVDIFYPVNTHSILDVEVLNESRYSELARKGDIEYYEPTSTFEWGPVSIGIAVSRQQPLQGNNTVPLIVAITNRGEGYLKTIDHFNVSSKPQIVSGETMENCTADLLRAFKIDLANKLRKQERETNEGLGLKPKDSLVEQCMIKVKNPDVNRKTYGITADLTYDYQISRTNSIKTIYECANDEDCKENEHCNVEEGRCAAGKTRGGCICRGYNCKCDFDDIWKDKHCCPDEAAHGCDSFQSLGTIKSARGRMYVLGQNLYRVNVSMKPKYALATAIGGEYSLGEKAIVSYWGITKEYFTLGQAPGGALPKDCDDDDPDQSEASAEVREIRGILDLPGGTKESDGTIRDDITLTFPTNAKVSGEERVLKKKDTDFSKQTETKCLNVTKGGRTKIWMEYDSYGNADYDFDNDAELVKNEVNSWIKADVKKVECCTDEDCKSGTCEKPEYECK